MNHGGIEAFMHDLLEIDLSAFNVRAKPSTPGLLEQKLKSLEPIERWWHDCLENGAFELVANEGGAVTSGRWLDFHVTTDIVDYVMLFSGGKVFRKPSSSEIVNTLCKICPSITRGQKSTGGIRRRGLCLPPLHVARKEFEKHLGGPLPWLHFNG